MRKRDTRPRRIARRGLPENVDSPSEACATFAINRLLQCPTVSSVIIGARNEEQLRQNLGAVGWALTPEQIKALDDASAVTAPYPYFTISAPGRLCPAQPASRLNPAPEQSQEKCEAVFRSELPKNKYLEQISDPMKS